MKVSAVITTHNRVDVLPRAIKSVLNQTYKDLELIIVSDGSTDGTDEYLKNFDSVPTVKVISYNPSKGGNFARNQGIIHAQGEYVAFLDDDDEWLPSKIEKQVAKIKEDDKIGLVFVGKNIIYVNEGINYISHAEKKENPAKDILFSNFIGTTSSVMVKTEIAKKVGMFDIDLKALQDYDLWIRVCQECYVSNVDEPLINYYNEGGRKQISDKHKVYEAAIQYITNKYRNLYSSLSQKELKKIEQNNLILLAKKCLRNNKPSQARKYFLKAMKGEINVNLLILYFSSFIPYNLLLKLRK